LSEEDASAAFYRVVKRRMRVYVDRALQQLEKRSNLRGANDERDVGDDPNIKRAGATLGIDAGGLPIELSNLVDFYTRNKLVVEENVEVEGEKKIVTKYPVSLRGELQPKVYNELYKQYVIQCFSAQTRSEKQRLFASLDQLGPILGMTDDEVTAIHSSIGTVIYKNYLGQCLLKGPIVEKDTEFLGNIQKMLLMKEETCQKLLREGKENRVSILLERIFAQPKILPETVKNVRAVAKSLEVDIVSDLKITKEQRKRLFSVEVDAGIDTGAIRADNQDLIKEVQSSLQVPDVDAREVLLACIQRRTLSYLVQASASLRQNRSANAISELRTMLRYGRLLPSPVIAPAVSDEEKQEMFLLFQADVISDGALSGEAKESLNLLKVLLGFSDADQDS
jgi:Chloroplast envelope transporter